MGLQHSPSIVRDGLVLYLDAANPKSYSGSGTTVFDLSSNQNNGTLVNGVGYSGSNLGSFSFDGVNDHTFLPSLNSLNIWDNDFTGMFWIFWTGGTVSGIFGMQSLPSNFHFEIRSGGLIRLRHAGMSDIQVSGVVDQSEWTLMSFTRSGSTYKVYKNTTEVGSRTQNPGTITQISQGPFIGESHFPIGARPFDGSIPLGLIYNRALSASEIKQNFEALRGRYGI
jgi:hypothetical protein